MYPPIFAPVDGSTACRALLRASGGPTRFYQFGMAPQYPTRPYAVWQRVGGSPENYLGQVPDMDGYEVQVDVYAVTADVVRAVALAIRDAIEPVCHITAWLGESRDPETGNYRFSFEASFMTPR